MLTIFKVFIEFVTKLHACVHAQLCLTLCNPLDCSPPGSSVHGILQARILERVAMPSSRGSSPPRDPTQAPRIAGGFFTTSAMWEARCKQNSLIFLKLDLCVRLVANAHAV